MDVAWVIVIGVVAALAGYGVCSVLSMARCNDCLRVQSVTVEPTWDRPKGELTVEGTLATGKASAAVLAERLRQQRVEGWTAEHDDQWTNGQLAIAGACYAIGAERVHVPRIVGRGTYFHFPTWSEPKRDQIAWPWAPKWWKPKDERCNLVRAGALILAELERLDRAATRAQAEVVQGVPS